MRRVLHSLRRRSVRPIEIDRRSRIFTRLSKIETFSSIGSFLRRDAGVRVLQTNCGEEGQRGCRVEGRPGGAEFDALRYVHVRQIVRRRAREAPRTDSLPLRRGGRGWRRHRRRRILEASRMPSPLRPVRPRGCHAGLGRTVARKTVVPPLFVRGIVSVAMGVRSTPRVDPARRIRFRHRGVRTGVEGTCVESHGHYGGDAGGLRSLSSPRGSGGVRCCRGGFLHGKGSLLVLFITVRMCWSRSGCSMCFGVKMRELFGGKPRPRYREMFSKEKEFDFFNI
mmetsp:Transcript_44111/g.134326  ORF Transcript_44111/g.134326 Transcript_44111/m.134326 type:complete len:281 (+) Transcript_44111:1079-1921(+)